MSGRLERASGRRGCPAGIRLPPSMPVHKSEVTSYTEHLTLPPAAGVVEHGAIRARRVVLYASREPSQKRDAFSPLRTWRGPQPAMACNPRPACVGPLGPHRRAPRGLPRSTRRLIERLLPAPTTRG
jgi:hypothetical protein